MQYLTSKPRRNVYITMADKASEFATLEISNKGFGVIRNTDFFFGEVAQLCEFHVYVCVHTYN